MFDITGPKVFVPALLFALMTPYLFGGLPPGKPLLMQAGFHAIAFSIISFLIMKYVMKVTVTKADIFMPILLFIMLSPGVIFSLPKDGGVSTVAVHATIFAIAFASLRGIFPEYY